MKVSIIGGGGLVGSSAAFALQCGGVVREIALVDVNEDLAAGQALDILHGGPSTADQIISAGSYEQIPDSDIICITAGLRRLDHAEGVLLSGHRDRIGVQVVHTSSCPLASMAKRPTDTSSPSLRATSTG